MTGCCITVTFPSTGFLTTSMAFRILALQAVLIVIFQSPILAATTARTSSPTPTSTASRTPTLTFTTRASSTLSPALPSRSFIECPATGIPLFAVAGQVLYLKSSDYSFAYGSLVNCSWYIYANSGRIKATIVNATTDFYFYIEIYDGFSQSSSLLARLSSMPSQPVYSSSGQYMYIRFFTTGLTATSFFSMTYEIWDPVPTTTTARISSATPTTTTTPTTTAARTSTPTFTRAASTIYGYYFQGPPTTSTTAASSPSITTTTARTSSPATTTPPRTSGPWTTTSARTSDTSLPSTTTGTSVCSVNPLTINLVPTQVGYLTSPNYPSPYYNNADCRWLMNAGSGYVVKVSVTDVRLEPCCDYLELYNGTFESSTLLIIRISSMPSQTVFYSSGQYMYIRFYSDGSVTNTGLRFTYEAVEQNTFTSGPATTVTTPTRTASPATTTTTTARAPSPITSTPTMTSRTSETSLPSTTAGTSVLPIAVLLLYAVPGKVNYLTSPNYPLPYYNNADIHWLIYAGRGHVVKVLVTDLNLELCCDYLKFYDDAQELSTLLVIGTSSIPLQSVYYSSGQYMYIRFSSDGSVTYTGFRLTYEAVNQQNESMSGPTLTTTTARTSSPTQTSITSRTSGPTLTTTTARTSSPTQTSTTARTSVTYAVPGHVSYLTSPNYPLPYYDNADIHWLIDAGSGYVVKVTVTDVNLETGYDYLELYDGSQELSTLLIIRISTMPSPTVFNSSGQYMYIKFHSDVSITSSGFRLTYEAVEQWSMSTSGPTLTTTTARTSSPTQTFNAARTSECPINAVTLYSLYWRSSYLTSPNYPSDYYNNADCRWLIDAGSGYAVRVTVLNVSLETGYDYFELYDGSQEQSTSIIRISSMPSQTVFFSTGQYMYIRFHSDGSITSSGSRLQLDAVYQKSACLASGTTLFPVLWNLGYISSPNYPFEYDDNTNCLWMIHSANNTVVKVTVLAAMLDGYDYVEIFDGMSTSSPSIVKFSEMPNSTVYYNSGQYMLIKFLSDDTVTYSGFRLTYVAVDQQFASAPDTTPTATPDTTTGCLVNSAPLTAVVWKFDYLASPNYPSNYNNNANCLWMIRSANNTVVKVTVFDAKMDGYDYVEIFDGMSTSSPSIVKFSSMPNSTVYYSSGQYMLIKFFSDFLVTKSGFRLTYVAVDQQFASAPDKTPTATPDTTTECLVSGVTLTAVVWKLSYLSSPNYPSNYDNNANCLWMISASTNSVVKVTVLDAKLEMNFDYVEIFDGMSTSSPSIVKFYTMPNSTVYYSSGQYMFIKFFSDGSFTNSGFRLTYMAVNQ